MFQRVQFLSSPTLLTLRRWLIEPTAQVTQSRDRRNARLIAGLLLMSFLMQITVRILRTVLHVPESVFDLNTFVLDTLIIIFCYVFSRTRYYRIAIIFGIVAVMSTFYLQSVYHTFTDPYHLTDSTIWVIAAILVGGLILSWQIMVAAAVIFVVAIAAMPLYVPGLTFYDVRTSLEFITGMTALITVTAILRQRDVERIQQQAKDLSISEARYRTLLNAGFEALIIHDNGRILDLNEAALGMTGYTADELIGKMTIELLPPDARPAIVKLYSERPTDNLVYESTVQHRDGHRIDVEVRSRTITYQGEVARVIAFRDITQAKQSSEQIKNLFNSLDRVFYSFSADDGHVLQISPACERLYGYPPQTFYEDVAIWSKVIHPDDKAQFLEDFAQVEGEQYDIQPFRIVRANDEIRWVEMIIIPVFNAAGERTRFDGLVTDITERRQIEAEQRILHTEHERSQVLRQFIADASHDLRTPLATLYTSLYLLRRVCPPDEKVTRYLDTLQTQSTHLARVLEDLFTMSRLDSPETYTEKRPLDVNQVLKNALTTQNEIAVEKGLQIHCVPSDTPLEIMADKDYLLIALNHVIKNAIQYTPADGSITIRTYSSDTHMAVIEVADTGIGIQPTELPLIFDRFYRSDRARKTEVGGVGLGLSLARKIVEVHGGTIEAESAPGMGSTFRITLPLMLK